MAGQHCDCCNRWLPNGRKHMWCEDCWPFDEPYPQRDEAQTGRQGNEG